MWTSVPVSVNHNAFTIDSVADQMQNVTIRSDEAPQHWKHCK